MFSKGGIKDYLEGLASAKPAPGGGSGAALVGAIGAACMSMTCEFTLGREKYKKYEKEIKAILNFSAKTRSDFLKLLDKDVASYGKVELALKMPKDTLRRIEIRKERLQVALMKSTDIPYEICKLACEGARLSGRLEVIGNKGLLCDTYASALFFDSAFWAAFANIKENLSSIKDEQYVGRISAGIKPLAKYMSGARIEIVEKNKGV